jgi:hypothetical protein
VPAEPRVAGGRLRRLPAAAVAAAGALTLVVLAHLVTVALWERRVRLLDAGYEWSFSHILATLGFASGAVICGIGALAGRRHRRWWWWAACALMAVLLLDNLTRLHENIPRWPLVYGPFLGALCLAVVRVAAETRWAGVVFAGVLLLCCSLAIHVIGPETVHLLGLSSEGWAVHLNLALKEGTELAGWILLVPALARLAVPLPRQSPPARTRPVRTARPRGAHSLGSAGAQPARADGDAPA